MPSPSTTVTPATPLPWPKPTTSGSATWRPLASSGARGGRARLFERDELADDWDPSEDSRLTDWECAQHLAKVLESAGGGIDAAARLYSKMDSDRSDSARMLAYRIYDICERKNRAQEAQTWNMLAPEWPALETAAAALQDAGTPGTLELDLTGGG